MLKALDRVSDAPKLQILLPLIQETLKTTPAIPDRQDLNILLVAAIDKSAAKDLNVGNSVAWSSLLVSSDASRSPGKYSSYFLLTCVDWDNH